jgi:hypothetical protein
MRELARTSRQENEKIFPARLTLAFSLRLRVSARENERAETLRERQKKWTDGPQKEKPAVVGGFA